MKNIPALAAALCVAVLFTPVAHAQNLYVGSNSSGVTTDFTSGTNAYASTFVGYDPGADSNTLNVLNTNTVLTNSGNLTVGGSGSGNSLVISNEGQVANNGVTIIGNSNTSSHNSVLVTGSNSLLSNGNWLVLGWDGSGNSLTMSNGGQTIATGVYVANNSGGSNTILVTGTGSLLYANGGRGEGDFWIGRSGFGNNRMVISDGGQVIDANASIGYGSTSSNNSVLVTGEGSRWDNSVREGFDGGLAVGNEGSGNRMVISNGGTVSDANASIGYGSTSSNNSVLVTGEGSRWNNSGTEIRGGGLTVGNQSSGNSLVISNRGTVANREVTIGFGAGSSNNTVLVTGSNSLLTNSSWLVAGFDGSGNSLTISNGARAIVTDVYVANASGGSNTILVTGTGSLLNANGVNGDFWIGRSGFGNNSLVISDGGTVSDTSASIGYASSASNNSVLVTGTNSLWTNSSRLLVGNGGSGNSLVISNGGTVAVASNSYIGYTNTASNNSVLVTGAGSLWTNSGELSVGYGGSNNTLTVANGGTVAATNIVLGSQAGSSGTLNIGRFGTNDAAGTINTPTIAFGTGTGTINFNQSNSTTVSAAISGAGTVNQLGSGTTTLSGSNSYTGATTVAAGTLLVGGQIGLSDVSVLSGAAIGGSGTLAGSLSMAAGGEFVFSLSGILVVNGASVTFGDFGIDDLVGLDGSVAESAYTLINGTAAINFSNVANLGVGNGSNIGGGKYAYFRADSPNLVVEVIPEPSTYALLVLAVIGLGAQCWRRRRKVA